MRFDGKKRRNRSETDKEPKNCEDTVLSIQFDELVEEFLVRTRRILVVGEINEISSAHICSNLQLFSLSESPIYMYINSPGGCLSSGYAIIDQMLACDCPVYTIIRGQGYSMGAMIAAFGTSGCRYATPNSSIMLHSVVVHNPPDSIGRTNEMTQYINTDYNNKIADLSKRMKLTPNKLMVLMDKTMWMSPKQAVRVGLIDGIWTQRMERMVNERAKK